ncbi:MAG: hypothetical protein H2042_03095 [Rhizobiales bacterium]|nr:hypothetical protein [Hyphomicrobiales bacterium]
MDELASRFIDARRNGAVIALADVTADDLVRASERLADEPEAVDFFCAVLALGTAEGIDAAARLSLSTADPFVMIEIVRALPHARPDDRGARVLQDAFIRQSARRERHHGTRSHALLGAMYVAQDRPSLLRALQSHLLDISPDDDGDYLRHAAKVQGLVLAHVHDPDLRAGLEALAAVPSAEDEAWVALGILHIADALDDRSRDGALNSFTESYECMQRAISATEVRYDAALYSACLRMLLAFQAGNHSDALHEHIACIKDAALTYCAFLLPSDRPSVVRGWLGSSILEGIHWSELGLRLAQLDLSLLKKAWLDAARIIEEQLVRAFDASRSILKRTTDGGVEAVIRPAIVAAMQGERSRLALLDEWLSENPGSVSTDAVIRIRLEIKTALEASLLRNPIEAAAAQATVADILSSNDMSPGLGASAIGMLAASISEEYLRGTHPVIVGLLERLEGKLLANPDYRDDAATFFRLILFHTLLFVVSRENLTGNAVHGIDYLFNLSTASPPVEADLQRDYFGFLQATPLKETADREVTGIAHGRADVFFHRSGIKTVAELKKVDVDLGLPNLVDSYGLQTTAYQRTNMRFCILMVLDLLDRGGGSDHISNLVDVISKSPKSGHAEYSVVVFRVQARKRSPSSL